MATTSRPKTTATPWGAAHAVEQLTLQQRAGDKRFVTLVQLLETDKGERALVMLGGDQNAISGHLKKALGSRNIRLADPEVVKATTGYVIGSIPPFHWQPEGFRSFLNASLMDEPVLGVGAGRWGEEIIIYDIATPDTPMVDSHGNVWTSNRMRRPANPAFCQAGS